WHKLCVGKDNSFGGFRIEVVSNQESPTQYRVSVPQSKKDKITGQIQEVLRSGVLTHATVESLIGRLLFCGQICPVYRCGLAVLYATDRVMERKKLRKIKCSEKLRGNLERWIEVLDSSFTRHVRATEFGETPITQQWLAVADASIDAIGAALIPRVGSNGFYSRVTTDELQTAVPELFRHDRMCGNMVFLELTALLLSVVMLKKEGIDTKRAVFLSDSQSG
ncbi:hypothetical protein FOZ61_004827, partial [Perkinsus olseni]